MRPTSQGREHCTRMGTARCLAPVDTGADVGAHWEVTATKACLSLNSEGVISGPPQNKVVSILALSPPCPERIPGHVGPPPVL